MTRKPPRQPADDLERVVRLEFGARDSADFDRVEFVEVGARAGEGGDPVPETLEQAFGEISGGAVVRVRAQEEEGLVKPDDAPRVRKSTSLEASEEADGLAAIRSVRPGGLEAS